jgi:hypothetical protein
VNPSRWFAALLLAAVPLWAQNAPHLAYAVPAGGQQGTTVQVTIGGQYLLNLSDVYISGGGVQATVGEYVRPMNAMQATHLRDRMQELQKGLMSAAVQKEMADIRAKLLMFNSTRLTSPVLAETITLQVAIAANAEPGKRELRVATPQGLSNPIVFCVGQLPEFVEKETINVDTGRGPAQVRIMQPATDMAITLPATVNGRIKPRIATRQVAGQAQPFTPGEADRYHFQAHQGQQLVIAASARELMPYLADAVPGWFQAVLTLYDADGREVAYDDDYRFHPDPVLHYAVPKDGEYVLEIKDALYRGREDFVYRIAIGELPFVTGSFPLGGKTGAKTSVALTGWNLPANRLVVDARHVPSSVPFMVDTLPEAFEKEPNNSQSTAQRIKLPITMNGRIDRPGDWDVFRFEGVAGQEIVAEVYARRLDSPLDSVLRLTDAKGRQLAFNDDHEDKGAGLETHHADSYIMTTLPARGTYYLYLGDIQQKGGPEYAYRLRISAPRPDFDLRVTPSAINAGGGQTVPITVYALRKDGFSGDITLSLKDAPRGFILTGGVLPAGEDKVRLTLTVPRQPRTAPMSLAVEGRATIEGREVARLAVPADDRMQAFAYWHLVPASDLQVEIRRAAAFATPIKVTGDQPVKIPAGGAARFQVQVPIPRNSLIERVQYELSDPPVGIKLKDASTAQGATEIVLECDAAKAKPGLKGNLIISLTAERTAPAANGRPQAARQRVPLGTLPAVPFEIVKP